MAPTISPLPAHTGVQGDSSDYNTAENRYQTEPAYSSSHILKSFKHEFHLFGHGNRGQAVRTSVSNPPSPRRGSVPVNSLETLEEIRPRSNSDPRRLSLPQVTEEVGEQGSGVGDTTTAVAVLSQPETQPKPQGQKKSKLLGSVAADTVDGAMIGGQKLPLTKQVMEWFTSPQSQVRVNKAEFNAMSPTSF